MSEAVRDEAVLSTAGRKWRRVGLLATSILVALIAAEAVYRMGEFGGERFEPRRIESSSGGVPFEMIPIADDPRFFAYRPNSQFASIYDPRGDKRGYFGSSGRVDYRINGMRMRSDSSTTLTAAATQVLCLGDSFTFGEGVHASDTYVAKLQAILNRDADHATVQVLNAGVQGYGTRQELVFFELYGRALKPDVVTLGFVLNDSCDVAETISQNDAMTRPIQPSAIGQMSALWGEIELRRHRSQLQEAFFRQIRGGFNSVEWDHCRVALDRFHAMAVEDGFEFLVVIFPIFWQLDRDYPFDDLHAKVAQACRDAKCEYIDLRDQYRDRPSEEFWVHPTDQHPNEIAHDRVAQAIAPRVAELLAMRGEKNAP